MSSNEIVGLFSPASPAVTASSTLTPGHSHLRSLLQRKSSGNGNNDEVETSPSRDRSSSPSSAPSSATPSEVDSSPSSPAESPRSPSPSPPSAPSSRPPSPSPNPSPQSEPVALTTTSTTTTSPRLLPAPPLVHPLPPPPYKSLLYQHLVSPYPVNPPGSRDPGRQGGGGTGSQGVKILGGRFLLLEQVEGSNLHKCIEVKTGKEYICKVVPTSPLGHILLNAHYRVDGHPHINPVKEVVIGDGKAHLFFPPVSSDLHSYVRTRRRLKEAQARVLFKQIVSAVHEAHAKGIVLRDLKLRKFVFTSESRLDLKLESLEDAVVLEDESDDLLSDKHGCPAYVSPEILKCNTRYSGRAADMWGLGVMLYTMLVGRYPFHGQEHTGLFAKIRRGHYSLPDSLSSRAKCLIRCLLRKDPDHRLTTEDVLIHPWLNQPTGGSGSRERLKRPSSSSSSSSSSLHYHDHCDQTVPDLLAPAAKRSKAGAVQKQ